MDCVVASLLAMTVTQSRCKPIQMRVRIPATHCARAAENCSPSKTEGAGNAGCALHPRSRVQCAQEDAHTSIQGSGGNPTFPAQWLYGLYRALPGERLSCHRRLADTSATLDASTAASGPHDFAVRSSTVRQGTFASTATRPTFVTMANAPLSRTGWPKMCP
jgi:hypothetical protein